MGIIKWPLGLITKLTTKAGRGVIIVCILTVGLRLVLQQWAGVEVVDDFTKHLGPLSDIQEQPYLWAMLGAFLIGFCVIAIANLKPAEGFRPWWNLGWVLVATPIVMIFLTEIVFVLELLRTEMFAWWDSVEILPKE